MLIAMLRNMHTERYLPLPIPGARMLGTPV